MKAKHNSNKMPGTEISQVVEFLKVIDEENRLKILWLLRKGEKCVCEIWPCLELAQNLTSHHLKILRDFGLVTTRQEGLNVIYSINKKVIKENSKLLNKYLNLLWRVRK